MQRGNESDTGTSFRVGVGSQRCCRQKVYKGRGCDHCNNTGYRGRVGLYELLSVNDEIKDLIIESASTELLRDAARRNGMVASS